MNYSEIRLFDPVFTKLAHGYTNPRIGVAEFISPIVPVPSRSGQIIQFGKDEFSVTNTKRAPGTNIRREGTSYTSAKFTLSQDALAAEVQYESIEEANQTGLRNLQRIHLNQVLNKLLLGWEVEVLDLVTNPDNFETSLTSTIGNKWNAASDPQSDIFSAKEAVRAQSAVYPNSMVIGPAVYQALMTNDAIREQFKYTTAGSINLDMLASYFDLRRGIRVSEQVKEVNGSFVDIMPRDSVLLFYAPPTITTGSLSGSAVDADMGIPSFCYTYTHRDYPQVTPFRQDPDRRVLVADVIHEHQAVITGIGQTGKAGAGYLLTNVIS